MAKKKSLSRTESIAFCGLSIALLAVSAWVTIPLGPVPFTLQILVLTMVLLLFPAREALIIIFGYLVLGAIGVPVFSGMRGGLGVLMGTTGGFLVGDAIGAVVVVLMLKLWAPPQGKVAKWVREYVAAFVFLAIVYLCGWAQLMFVADLGPAAAFAAGIAPFILVDTIKIVLGATLAHALRGAVPALKNVNQRA